MAADERDYNRHTLSRSLGRLASDIAVCHNKVRLVCVSGLNRSFPISYVLSRDNYWAE